LATPSFPLSGQAKAVAKENSLICGDYSTKPSQLSGPTIYIFEKFLHLEGTTPANKSISVRFGFSLFLLPYYNYKCKNGLAATVLGLRFWVWR